jgi:hypothetical protein
MEAKMANSYDKDSLPSIIRGALLRYDRMILDPERLTRFVLKTWGIARQYHDEVLAAVESELEREEKNVSTAGSPWRGYALERAQAFLDRLKRLAESEFEADDLSTMTKSDRVRFFKLLTAAGYEQFEDLRMWEPAEDAPAAAEAQP